MLRTMLTAATVTVCIAAMPALAQAQTPPAKPPAAAPAAKPPVKMAAPARHYVHHWRRHHWHHWRYC